jgi:CRISPR-associated protein Cas2
MTILILERVKVSLRGELTRWMLEPKTGVFIGRPSSRVREKLWQKVCQATGDGAAMLIWSTNNEQGYKIDFWGETSRYVFDWEGLQLITRPHPKQNVTQPKASPAATTPVAPNDPKTETIAPSEPSKAETPQIKKNADPVPTVNQIPLVFE